MPESVSCPKCSANVPAGARFCQVCGASASGGNTPARPIAARKPAKNQKPVKSPWTTLVAGAIIVLIVAGLAIAGFSRMGKAETASATHEHDMAAMVEHAGPMPTWLASAPKAVISDYAWAASHHDELQYFPCFCGCFNEAGHVSNSECYFQRDKGKKILAYDGHAFGWQICLDITRDVRKGMDKGKTLTQIRKEVDARYGGQGLKPTPAPLPPNGI